MTLNKKINNMSTDEKAEFFEKYITCPLCPIVDCNGSKESCTKNLKTMLENEA